MQLYLIQLHTGLGRVTLYLDTVTNLIEGTNMKTKHSPGPYILVRKSPYMVELSSKDAGLIGMVTAKHGELFQASPAMFELLVYIDKSLDVERKAAGNDAYLFSGIHDEIKTLIRSALGRDRKGNI